MKSTFSKAVLLRCLGATRATFSQKIYLKDICYDLVYRANIEYIHVILSSKGFAP